MPVPIRRPATVLLVTAALALAGCSASGGSAGSGGMAAADSSSAASKAAPAAASHDGAAAKGGTTTLDPAAVTARVVRTAQVVVEVKGDLAVAAAKVRAVADSVGGTVATETTSYADATVTATPQPAGGTSKPDAVPTALPGESVLVLRVPSDALDRALTLVTGPGGVGEELTRSATSQDVTGDLADLQSRVATQRASVARVRALLAKAVSLQEIVSIESEVTKRESDLEAAEARQAALADRADLATLTVDLRLPAAIPPPAPAPPNAFITGLNNGWEAVTASTTVVLTVLGALLPVAVVVGVVGLPVLWWMRRRRVVPPLAPPPAPDAGP